VNQPPEITTLFGSRKSGGTTTEPSGGIALRHFAKFLGRALLFFSIFPFLLSGYLAFNSYWFQKRWTKSEATVVSGKIRQLSSGPDSYGHSSTSYFFHCTVSYSAAGQTRQSQLDSPGSPYMLDAQVWAGTWSPGQHIEIRYKNSTPSKIRLDNNPAAITTLGSLRFAFYFVVPGIFLTLTSRSERADAQ